MGTLLQDQSFFLQPGDVYRVDLGLPAGTLYSSWNVEAGPYGGAVDITDWFDFDGSFLSINAPNDLFSNSTYYSGDNPLSHRGHVYEHMDLSLTVVTDAGDFYRDDFSVSITPIASLNSVSGYSDKFFLDYTTSFYSSFSEDGALLINSSDDTVNFGDISIGSGAVIEPDGDYFDISDLSYLHEKAGLPSIEVTGTSNDDYVDFESWGRDDFSTSVEHEALNVNWTPGDDIFVAPTFNDSQGKLYAGNATDWYLAVLRAQHDIDIYTDVELYDFPDYRTDLTLMAEVRHNGLTFEYGSAENVSVSNNTSGLLHPDISYDAQFINFDAVSGSFANDVFVGSDGSQNFRSIGGNDLMTGGDGQDTFRIEKTEYWGTYQDEYEWMLAIEGDEFNLPEISITITDYEAGERIGIEEFGASYSDNLLGQFETRYDDTENVTRISLNVDDHVNDDGNQVISEYYEDLINVHGEWQILSAYEYGSHENLGLTLIGSEGLIGGDGDDNIAAYGDLHRYDPELQGNADIKIDGGLGADKIAGGAGNDRLIGGTNPDNLDRWGRQAEIDRVMYIDSDGITGNFSDQIYTTNWMGESITLEANRVSDGLGSNAVDEVYGFERVYGSRGDDLVVLSTDQFRGYTPIYGNDTVHVVGTISPGRGSYLGYWNLEDATSGHEPAVEDSGAVSASVWFDFDTGIANKSVTFDTGETQHWQDTITGAYTGFVGSRGDDVVFGSDSGEAIWIDGEINHYKGWLMGYFGDDHIIIDGDGNDFVRGGEGDDVIIVEGGGHDVVYGNASSGDYNWPNSEMSDNDTFVVGGATGRLELLDYEDGEEIVLLGFGSDVTIDTNYDWASDTTSLVIYGNNLLNAAIDLADGLSDRVVISGNYAVSSLEQALTYENEFRDQFYNSDIDTIVTLSKTDEVPFESIALGSDIDSFFGDGGAQFVRTGGGDDAIKTLAGDDYVLVQGEGDVTIDVGDGSDVVEVESDFAGNIEITNGAGGDFDPSALMLKINKDIGRSGRINENDLRIGYFDSDDEIIIKDYYTTDDQGYTTIAGTTIHMDGWQGWDGGYVDGVFDWAVGTGGQDQFYSSALLTGEVDEEVIYALSGRDGDDIIHSGGGTNLLFGGGGDDIFYVSGDAQLTSIVADKETTVDEQYINPSLNQYGLPNYGSAAGTTNTNYADKVYIDWVYDADSIAEISGTNGQGVVVWNDDLGARVEIYDAEELIFRSATDPTQWDAGISIGETAVVGIGTDPDDPLSWMNGHHGKSFSYAGNNVRFVLTDKPAEDGGPAAALNGDASSDWLQVYATVTTTEKYTYYQHRNGKTRNSPAKNYSKKTGTREVEEEALIWEGDRSAVGKFDFEDIDIQVINVQEQDAFGDPILYTAGTENTDLIFGNQYANIIDGGGGDDIIFGGGGDDVLIGGEGDDVITGGYGDDIIRGDGIDADDAAYEEISAMADTLAELAAEEDPDTDIGQVVNDTLNDFSVGTGNDGNDTILGGDGVDDIDSGDGENFVTSGRLELETEGETDLETLQDHIKSHKDIFDDDDWI